MGTQKKRLAETILLSNHNMGLESQIRILEDAKHPLSRAVFTLSNLQMHLHTPAADNFWKEWQKEKLLIISNFFFCYNVFNCIKKKKSI